MENIKEVDRGIQDGAQWTQRRVIVLLSTYNGEQFLKELLESVLAQKRVNVFLLVRDDGSTDATPDILKFFAKEHCNMSYFLGENIGAIKSFNELINHPTVNHFDYVAFCDQDDVWLPEKLAYAIEKIENDNMPSLYCSNLRVVDENLCFLRMYQKKNLHFSKYTAIVQNCATGCTEVFNHKAVELYRMGIGKRMEMHDYWMFLLCLYLGNVYYDEYAYILYRQHESNVVGARQKDVRSALEHIHSNYGRREAMLCDFLKVYENLLTSKSYSIVVPASNISTSMKHRLLLFWGPRYHASSFWVTLNFKVRVVLGRLY